MARSSVKRSTSTARTASSSPPATAPAPSSSSATSWAAWCARWRAKTRSRASTARSACARVCTRAAGHVLDIERNVVGDVLALRAGGGPAVAPGSEVKQEAAARLGGQVHTQPPGPGDGAPPARRRAQRVAARQARPPAHPRDLVRQEAGRAPSRTPGSRTIDSRRSSTRSTAPCNLRARQPRQPDRRR